MKLGWKRRAIQGSQRGQVCVTGGTLVTAREAREVRPVLKMLVETVALRIPMHLPIEVCFRLPGLWRRPEIERQQIGRQFRTEEALLCNSPISSGGNGCCEMSCDRLIGTWARHHRISISVLLILSWQPCGSPCHPEEAKT